MSEQVTTRWKLERGAIARLKNGESQRLAWTEITSPLAQAGLLRLALTADASLLEDWQYFKSSLTADLPFWITEANADLVAALMKLTGDKKAQVEAKLAALNPTAIDELRNKPQVQAILNPVSLESLL